MDGLRELLPSSRFLSFSGKSWRVFKFYADVSIETMIIASPRLVAFDYALSGKLWVYAGSVSYGNLHMRLELRLLIIKTEGVGFNRVGRVTSHAI